MAHQVAKCCSCVVTQVESAHMPFGAKSAFDYQHLDAPTYHRSLKQIFQARITVPPPPPAAPFAWPVSRASTLR